jgi:hypothetical protein
VPDGKYSASSTTIDAFHPVVSDLNPHRDKGELVINEIGTFSCSFVTKKTGDQTGRLAGEELMMHARIGL